MWTPSDETLAHHGIAGQKWGTRNGPPYPLNQSSKSSCEKRPEKASVGGYSKENQNGCKRGLSDKSDKKTKIIKNRDYSLEPDKLIVGGK